MTKVLATNLTQQAWRLRLKAKSKSLSSRRDASHSIEETLHAMSRLLSARDHYTLDHSQRVAKLAFDLALIYELSNEACQEIYLAGILHDIGKVGMPDSVLLKNGPLTEEEYGIVKLHPLIGYRIMERLAHLHFVLPGVLYHHERCDGTGYPHGLSSPSIPAMARIMAVADAYDAMTSSRPYRQAMPVEKAQQIIEAGAGVQWDAEVVECLLVWLNRRQANIARSSCDNLIPDHSATKQIAKAAKVVSL